MSKLKWLVAGVLGLVVLVVGGTWVYINLVREDAPPPLALSDPDDDLAAGGSTTTAAEEGDAAATPVEGTWAPTPESVVGYRVAEILFGQSVEAVGRTNAVTGTLTIEGTTVTDASFEVDMATVESDESRRDGQFRGRIMDVATFPTATLVLTEPVDLGGEPADGEVVAATATVDLTLRGTTRTVEIDLEAQRAGGRIEVVGSLPIVFADWGIPNPSAPGIDTEDEGVLEVLLVLERARP